MSGCELMGVSLTQGMAHREGLGALAAVPWLLVPAVSRCILRSIWEKLLFGSLQGPARDYPLSGKFPGWQKECKAKWTDLGGSIHCAPMGAFLEEARHRDLPAPFRDGALHLGQKQAKSPTPLIDPMPWQ